MLHVHLFCMYDHRLLRQLWSDFENSFYLKGRTVVVWFYWLQMRIWRGDLGPNGNTQFLTINLSAHIHWFPLRLFKFCYDKFINVKYVLLIFNNSYFNNNNFEFFYIFGYTKIKYIFTLKIWNIYKENPTLKTKKRITT